ncbi:hypothetical protein HQ576_01600 [bacterium]|nr:hypothetical protein [bacterium]
MTRRVPLIWLFLTSVWASTWAAAPPEAPYVRGVEQLKPLWQQRLFAEALTKAKLLAQQKELVEAPAAAKALVEDAEALNAFWEAVRAGARKLEPGSPFRVRGMLGKVVKVEGDTMHVAVGAAVMRQKLADLKDAELIALARQARPAASGQDHLGLALLALHARKPDQAKAEGALLRAAKAGVDTTRHKAWLGTTGHVPTPTQPVGPSTPAAPDEAEAPGPTLTIGAQVDGQSDLVVTPDGAFWHHRSGERPGTPFEAVKATVPTVLNGKKWFPRWRENQSDRRRIRELPKSFADLTCELTKSKGPGAVGIAEASGSRLVVRFNDRSKGAHEYQVQITFVPVKSLSYEQAFGAGLDAIALGNAATAKAARARAEALKGSAAAPQALLDKTYTEAMTRAVAHAEMAEWEKVQVLLRFASVSKPDASDIRTLTRWLKTAAKPHFVENFDTGSLARWEIENGNWKVKDGHVTVSVGTHNAQILIKRARFKDFVFTFDMWGGGPFRFGAIVRYTPKRYIHCLLSGCYHLLYVGGSTGWGRGQSGRAEGITVRYTRKDWSRSGGENYPFVTNKPYHVTVRCADTKFTCHIDGGLVAIGRDEKPASGMLGFHVHGTASFDNVRVYRAVPLPELECTRPAP